MVAPVRSSGKRASRVRLAWLAGSVVVALTIVVALATSYRNSFAELEKARTGHHEARRAAALQAERRDRLNELLGGENGTAAILAAGSDGEAQASLQRRLTAALRISAAELASLEVLPVTDEGSYRRISLRADLRVDLGGLQRLLHDLEFGLPLIAVERLRIRAPGGRAIGVDRRLSVDIEIAALQQVAGQ